MIWYLWLTNCRLTISTTTVFNDAVQYTCTRAARAVFSVLSALGAVTEKIGLAGTVSSSFIQPFAAARTLATLDHLTCGRAAWNVVTSTSDAEARQISANAA